MKQPTIKYGEKQPIPCKNCGFAGYTFIDNVRKYLTTRFNSDGEYSGCHYSEMETIIHKGNTAICPECGENLKFKIDRENEGKTWEHS